MLSRDEFAAAVLIELAARGETTATYDPETFSIVHTPQADGTNASAWRTQLDRWYEKYQAAEGVGQDDEVIAEVAKSWADTLQWAKREEPPNKARIVPLVRSRFDYELSSLQTALQLKRQPRELMEVFVHQPLAEHLDVILAEDTPDRYNQITRPMLERLKLSWDEALRLAMWNLPQIDPGFAADLPFKKREGGYWVYTGQPSELFTSWLLLPEKIRRLPVKGRHVAFVPKVSLLAVTGTDEIDTLQNLIAKMREVLGKPEGRTVSAIPQVLEASGWKPWLPPPSHPLYWSMKELHFTELDSHYETQTELLKELGERDQGDEAPFVASYQVGQFGEHSYSAGGLRGSAPILTSQCIWPETVDALLPKTEVVILKQLLNREELEQNEDAEPEFGNWLTITWQQFEAYLGPRLKKLDYYPERYQVAGDDFPTGADWQRLKREEVQLPLENQSPSTARPSPPAAATTARTTAVSSSMPLAGTQLATPLAPPAVSKPPPEPSWWPLLAVCMMGVCCLGGSVGAIILGIQQLQMVFAGDVRPIPVAGAKQPPQQPFAPQAGAPWQPPPQVAAEAPQPLDAAKIQNEIQEAMQRMEEQLARDLNLPEPSPPPDPPLPESPPTEPRQAELAPLPLLGVPEQELPLLEFGPQDISAIGPEIHGVELFQDVGPAGGWLVGLRAVKGESWGGSILALQPVYQVGGEYQLGQQCGGGKNAVDQVQLLAKPGYAVGKIDCRLGLILNAVRVEFYRVDGQRLNPADKHATDWVGGNGGGLQMLDGQGLPLVGLAGSFDPEGEVITIQALQKKP